MCLIISAQFSGIIMTAMSRDPSYAHVTDMRPAHNTPNFCCHFTLIFK
jgi:hypothetical protein